MLLIKQSTARTIVLGPFVDSTDGVTAKTALTIAQASIRLSKNGGAYAQTNNTAGATHMENGNYSVPLDATDTNTLGHLRVSVAVATALPAWLDCLVMPAQVWDSFFGADLLQIDVTQWLGTGVTAGAIPAAAAGGSGGLPTVDASNRVAGVSGNVAGSVGSVSGAVASVTAGVTVTTNNDKTGYGLAADQAVNVSKWNGAAVSTPAVAGQPVVTLGATQAAYAPAKAGDTMVAGTVSDKAGYGLTAGEHTAIASDTQTGLTAQGYTTTRAGYLDTLSGLVQAIWDKATTALTAAGSIGKLLVDDVDAKVSSRSTYAGGAVASVTGDVGGKVLGGGASAISGTGVTAQLAANQDVRNVSGSVGSVTADVGITQAGADKVWGSTSRTLTSFGSLVSDIATAVWGAATRTLSAFGFSVTAGTVSDKTGYSLATPPPDAAGIADAVWDEALASHLTSGSTGAGLNAAGAAGDPWATSLPGAYGSGTAGKLVGDNLDAAVSSRSTYDGSDTSGTTTLLGRVVGTLDAGTHQPQSGDAYARIGAGGAGLTALGDTRLGNLDTTVSSRLAADGYTAPDNAGVAAIQAQTDRLVFSGGDVKATLDGETVALTSSELNLIADALLQRDWTLVTGEAERSVLNALRMMRNKWSVTGTTLTVCKEDDVTPAWTASVTASAGADPITGSDPA